MYRQITNSRIFSKISNCDASVFTVDFPKDVCYHTEYQFLKSVFGAPDINVYCPYSHQQRSICHCLKEFAVYLPTMEH